MNEAYEVCSSDLQQSCISPAATLKITLVQYESMSLSIFKAKLIYVGFGRVKNAPFLNSGNNFSSNDLFRSLFHMKTQNHIYQQVAIKSNYFQKRALFFIMCELLKSFKKSLSVLDITGELVY